MNFPVLPADCRYQPDFLDETASQHYFEKVFELVPYVTPRLQYSSYGKTGPLPRDYAFRADFAPDGSHPVYRYDSKEPPYPVYHSMEPILGEVRDKVTEVTGQYCNSCVVTFYQDGSDKIGYHQDVIGDLAPGSAVYTVSLGETRRFRLKSSRESLGIDLTAGSLFVLGWDANQEYERAIMRTKSTAGRRISLTFRSIATRNTQLEQCLFILPSL